jgi:GTP cyclohydrolase II
MRCDCGAQLDQALRRIGEEGRGVLLYLDAGFSSSLRIA